MDSCLYVRCLLIHTCEQYAHVPILHICEFHDKSHPFQPYKNTNVLQACSNPYMPQVSYLDYGPNLHKSIKFGPIEVSEQRAHHGYFNMSAQIAMRIICTSHCHTNDYVKFNTYQDRPMSISVNIENSFGTIIGRQLIPILCESSVKTSKKFSPLIQNTHGLSEKVLSDLDVFINLLCGFALDQNISVQLIHQRITRRMYCIVNRGKTETTLSS